MDSHSHVVTAPALGPGMLMTARRNTKTLSHKYLISLIDTGLGIHACHKCRPEPLTHLNMPHLERTEPQATRMVAAWSLNPDALQDIIVGGAIFASITALFVNGLKKEAAVCPSCNGTGGVKCFACNGTGIMGEDLSDDIADDARRESIGRTRNPRECRACKGVGLLFCKRCGGSGYL